MNEIRHRFKRICSIRHRFYSISQFDLVRSSRQIQQILFKENQNETNSLMKTLFDQLNSIHWEYQLKPIVESTKNIYEKNSSKFNEKFLIYEKQRKSNDEEFSLSNPFLRCLIDLRYNRYLHISSIYRFLTFNIDRTISQLNRSIFDFIQNENLFSSKFDLSEIFRYEFSFFIYSFSSQKNFDEIQKVLSKKSIDEYFLRSLNFLIKQKRKSLEIDQISLTLNSFKTNSNSNEFYSILFDYLFSCPSISSHEFIRFLSTFDKTKYSNSFEFIEKFDRFLNQIEFDEKNLKKNFSLLNLISSINFSHQNFQEKILQQIQFYLQQSEKSPIRRDLKMFSQLISLLCSTDPSNQFSSRQTILLLADRICQTFDLQKHFQFIHFIIQSQHSMMFIDLYNYPFISKTIQQKSLPFLFRHCGTHSSTIRRQIFEFQQIFKIDRPDFHASLFNDETIRFLQQIYEDYRKTIRSKGETTYEKYLHEIKDSFNQIYGNDQAKIISTEKDFPYLLFDFLEVKYPDDEFLRSLQFDSNQRVVLLPILNSMLIRQKRSDGKFYRIFNAQTTMRFRIISKQNFLVLPVFIGQYHRAKRDQQLKDFFDKCFIEKSHRTSSSSFLT